MAVETYADLSRILAAAMRTHDTPQYAGVPIPLPEYPVTVEKNYPFKGIETMYEEEQPPSPLLDPTERVVNRLQYARKDGFSVFLTQRDTEAGEKRTRAYLGHNTDWQERFRMLLDTLGISVVWPAEAETTAMERLAELVTPHAFRTYLLTGAFLETSKRSGVTYMFRRLRPTIACRQVEDTKRISILAALCLHPIAYYKNSWAGTMVPTDDVIAHLMLMRGDEVMLWRRAEQHAPESLEAGL